MFASTVPLFTKNVESLNTDTSSGTVWSEHIQPRLTVNNTHFIYNTTWGLYMFPKLQPYICSYASRNNEVMVSFSTFWVNTSKPLSPFNPTVLIADNTFFKVQVDAYQLATKAATLTQEWSFNRSDKPKISVKLNKANWNYGSFKIFWVVSGWNYIKDEAKAINCDATLTYWRKGVSVEVVKNENQTEWDKMLIIDWSDEGLADVYYGRLNLFTYNLAVVKVDFNVDDTYVDPSLVGTSTSAYANSYPFQRKEFYANGLIWKFYSDGTNMVYKTSSDGVTWSAATAIREATYGYRFSVDFNGTHLAYAYASSASGDSLYWRMGVPNSDGTITWSAPEQVAVAGASCGIHLLFLANLCA